MEFKWLNKSTIKQTKSRIEIMSPTQTDFFCGSIDECENGILPESLCMPSIPANPVIKAGLLAQAPVGNGGMRVYENLSIGGRTVKNIRAGK